MLVSDNASQDDTASALEQYARTAAWFRHRRNGQNLGFSGNYRQCVMAAQARYLWVLGDDDILEPGAVAVIMAALRDHSPAAVIMLDGLRVVRVDPETIRADRPVQLLLPSYAAFLKASRGALEQLAIAHTWIPSVVFERTALDLDEYDRHPRTYFGYAYGLAKGLGRGGSILLHSGRLLRLRERRAAHQYSGVPLQQNRLMMTLGVWARDPVIFARGLRGWPRSLASFVYRRARARLSRPVV